jgi:hypothetical protein
MSELVESALHLLPPPCRHSTLADIADRDALYQAMEGR